MYNDAVPEHVQGSVAVPDDGRQPHSAACATDAPPGSGTPSQEIAVSVVMPVFNEEAVISSVMEEALAAMRLCGFRFEIVAVDDASTDSTPEILASWQQRHADCIRVLRHKTNQGIAQACETLFRSARGTHVFVNGSDGQWKTAECLRMLPHRDQLDIIVGVRRRKHYGLWRSLVSHMFNLAPWLLFGVRTFDAGSIKLYRREVFDIPLISRGPFREAERLIRAQRRGYRISAIDVDFSPRRSGTATGARFGLIVQAMCDLARCWWQIVVLRKW